MSGRGATLALLLGLFCAGCAHQRAPDAYTVRLEALAVLQSLNAGLLSQNSATLTLERWCAEHGLAEPARISAERVRDADQPATAQQRELLRVSAGEPVRHRRVRLRCGEHVLSEADNWYVPSRLTAQMNHDLETSDVAFGRAVQALQFQRRTLAAQLLWSPLPPGWDTAPRPPAAAAQPLQIPPHILRHTAVLTLPDGQPISTVVETYTSAALGFLRAR